MRKDSMITFQDLAGMVRKEIMQDMKEDGFETFKEMKDCYWWEAADVKGYVSDIVTEIGNDLYDKNVTPDAIFMSDDHTLICIGPVRDMYWKDFKKMVFANL